MYYIYPLFAAHDDGIQTVDTPTSSNSVDDDAPSAKKSKICNPFKTRTSDNVRNSSDDFRMSILESMERSNTAVLNQVKEICDSNNKMFDKFADLIKTIAQPSVSQFPYPPQYQSPFQFPDSFQYQSPSQFMTASQYPNPLQNQNNSHESSQPHPQSQNRSQIQPQLPQNQINPEPKFPRIASPDGWCIQELD